MTTPGERSSLYFLGERAIEVRQEPCPQPGQGELLVQTVVSAVSPGTEMLFYRGDVPESLPVDASLAALSGRVEYPLPYGYAAVGRVVEIGDQVDPDWLGRRLFAFHPHASHFAVPLAAAYPVPDQLSDEQAALLPNTETAVNFLLDGQPALGERVLVAGLGVVGLLTVRLLSRFPLAELIAVDPLPHRRRIARTLGAGQVLAPEELTKRGSMGLDLIYELSGNPIALDQCIQHAGFDGRIVVGSWYGSKRVSLDLGSIFHRNRVRLISSQVSTIGPAVSGRWDTARRIATAWDMLQDLDTRTLVSHRFRLDAAAAAYALIDQHPEETLQVMLTYR